MQQRIKAVGNGMQKDDENEIDTFTDDINDLLLRVRRVRVEHPFGGAQAPRQNFVQLLQSFSDSLLTHGLSREAEAIIQALDHTIEDKFHGGLGISSSDHFSPDTREAISFQVEIFLESLNSEDNARKLLEPLRTRPKERKPMTLSQKVLAHHSVGPIPFQGLSAGDLVRTSIDWVISSELAWEMLRALMEKTGAKTIFRNDRLWLAGDHRVDPRNYETPKSKEIMEEMSKAERDLKLTEFKGNNYTIIHTEFVRERAEPGTLVIGADSHTCSSGAVGCLAIGLGAEDVVIPLITGETWFKVPECVNIVFTGKPLPGIGGKDVILYILKELKRNTVAANRIVEFSGPGTKHLSIDARFAISNMCTEFGAVTGIFVPDAITQNYVNSRRRRRRPCRDRNPTSIYLKPDENAVYAQTLEIDLSYVNPFIALYPSPDNVVLVTEQAGKKIDGCFIGACTTTEEDLVLAALVLKAGLARRLDIALGIRHVTPGSLPIVKRLESLGLLEIYEKAGFTRGVPGCSYCVGVADTAPQGTTWLTSQNRNFPNRMGKGSFANLASAITVAASSFSMTVTDPSPLLKEIDLEIWGRYEDVVGRKSGREKSNEDLVVPEYLEPNFTHTVGRKIADSAVKRKEVKKKEPIQSRVVTLGDFIDTDALAPSEFLLTALTNEALGVPDFRDKVKGGQRVVVAGKAFGVGSSRENAPRALKGLGVQCVIARSFAFIYARNQPNLGLLGIVIEDNTLHEAAQDGIPIEVDLNVRQVRIGSQSWDFKLDDMELALVENDGMTESYRKFGREVFEKLTPGGVGIDDGDGWVTPEAEVPETLKELQW
ncbi:Fc.00g115970.m01.CDS01 [Cosmosporella sp. VM-42]